MAYKIDSETREQLKVHMAKVKENYAEKILNDWKKGKTSSCPFCFFENTVESYDYDVVWETNPPFMHIYYECDSCGKRFYTDNDIVFDADGGFMER